MKPSLRPMNARLVLPPESTMGRLLKLTPTPCAPRLHRRFPSAEHPAGGLGRSQSATACRVPRLSKTKILFCQVPPLDSTHGDLRTMAPTEATASGVGQVGAALAGS